MPFTPVRIRYMDLKMVELRKEQGTFKKENVDEVDVGR
jgi:hypothetical protein